VKILFGIYFKSERENIQMFFDLIYDSWSVCELVIRALVSPPIFWKWLMGLFH